MNRENLNNYYLRLIEISKRNHQRLRDVVVDTELIHHQISDEQLDSLSTEGSPSRISDAVLAAISLEFRLHFSIQNPNDATVIYTEILTTFFGNA